MKELKKYKNPQLDRESVVSEPVISYRVETEESACKFFASRDDFSRAISSEDLLNRLRPRIKSLFL